MAFTMIASCLAVIGQFIISRDITMLNQPMEVYGYGHHLADLYGVAGIHAGIGHSKNHRISPSLAALDQLPRLCWL